MCIRDRDPKVRATNFDEVCYGYNQDEAIEEAARCIHCKNCLLYTSKKAQKHTALPGNAIRKHPESGERAVKRRQPLQKAD